MSVSANLVRQYQVRIESGNHVIIADEPLDHNGSDLGTDPYGLYLSGLAACKVMTVQMYAQRKQWPLEGMDVTIVRQKVKAKDYAEAVSETGFVEVIDCKMTFQGDLSAEQHERLREISERCPVHRSMKGETIIHSMLAEPTP